ncbi:hypothetical protein SKAU_G00269030 [Synaphobranchus kaupii]|uniref:Sushi domain-containing protein n=1 Tax=Synaphobranchus kaupii TaxID=118154 RepID=A0A9Q1IQD7_SYNKA|nr:hypothetical protein SKAU_G00269030 [Synaphobranchus kaupii]
MTLATWVCLVVVAVLPPLCAGVLEEKDCSAEGLSISGGNYTLSNGMKPDSEVVYKCAEGYYPSPTTSRRCHMRGKWSPATNIKYPAECKR